MRDEELHLWQGIVLLCIETLEKVPSMPFAHDFRTLFFKNELHWWKLIWLRFLGKQGVDVLERDIADGMDEMDEILLGRAICYLGDIKSRVRYNEIMEFIIEAPSFLRLRALYYLWRVEPEQFYSRLHDLARLVSGKILISDDEPGVIEILRVQLEYDGLGMVHLSCENCQRYFGFIQANG